MEKPQGGGKWHPPSSSPRYLRVNMMTSKNEVKAIIQTKHGITKHVNINGKIIISAKYIIAGILLHVFARTLYI